MGGLMDRTIKRHTITLVVRIWAEYLEQSPPLWRGEIERLDSGEKAHFQQLPQILGFIQRSLTPETTPETIKDKE
jgi:hypothetical protein